MATFMRMTGTKILYLVLPALLFVFSGCSTSTPKKTIAPKKSEEITYLRKKNPITSKRMELKVRTVEGQAGAITLYVIPANNENFKDEGDENGEL